MKRLTLNLLDAATPLSLLPARSYFPAGTMQSC